MPDSILFKESRFSVCEKRKGAVTRQYVAHPGAVVILPWLDHDTVVLIRNQRDIVGQQLIELPAGTLEPAERPIDCAARELIEETGYQAQQLIPLFECYSTPGFCNEKIYFFAARELTYVGQQLDETEEIDVFSSSIQEARKMIQLGQIVDMKTIAALLYLNT